MAGIGIQLTKIFDKHTVTASLYGIGFSIMYTIAPMLIVVGCLLGMYEVLGFDMVEYVDREIFSCSLLYIFIFSLLSSAPFNTVLSKYQTDKIYEQRYEDIRPCIFVGTVTNLSFSSIIAIPFYIYEAVVGKVPVYYVFTTFMLYLGLTLTFSTMIYNSILKQYKKISLYFLYSMLLAFFLSLFLHYILSFSVTYSMLFSLAIGFLLIGSLELANILRYFPGNSRRYKEVLHYFGTYWKLIASNFLYTLGLFVHNFVFWSLPSHMVVRDTYVCNQTYDMASCLAMITSISASVLFVSRVEMHFHERYKEYTDCIIGGKLDSIERAKKRMFRGLSSQIFSLVHMQFIVTIVIFLLAIVILPIVGFSGMIMEIYPQLAIGYFISYLMYAELLFLFYYDDLTGTVINSAIFAGVALIGSIIATHFSAIWYGAGFTAASFLAFTYSYFRLSWIEKNLDYHIYCRGSVVRQVKGDIPNSQVYNVYKNNEESSI
jgi:Predicted membrane protein